MTSIASTSHPSDTHNAADHLPPRSSKSLLASTWQVLDQPPPPSLREILGAYRTRGDGDREMLMAMLNAKSAEDQRIASVASLHRSMLEYYQISSTNARSSLPLIESDKVILPGSHPTDLGFTSCPNSAFSGQSKWHPEPTLYSSASAQAHSDFGVSTIHVSLHPELLYSFTASWAFIAAIFFA